MICFFYKLMFEVKFVVGVLELVELDGQFVIMLEIVGVMERIGWFVLVVVFICLKDWCVDKEGQGF